MLRQVLQQVPDAIVVGDYIIAGKRRKMPARALFLAPEAAEAYEEIAAVVQISDMYRSPESSLEAVQRGRGALPPGYSQHNYGYAIDLALAESMRNLGIALELGRAATKRELDRWMAAHGWYCLRRDHLMKSEAWHYNYLGIGVTIGAGRNSSYNLAEKQLAKLYGAAWDATPIECQRMLAKLRFYHGAIDGKIGPQSRQAIAALQRAWCVRGEQDGTLGPRTKRTLALVSCERVIQQDPDGHDPAIDAMVTFNRGGDS